MSLRIGIIGIGNMGGAHLRNFIDKKIKNAEITALCDIDKEHLYKYGDSLDPSVAYFESADELIASGLVDGVLIATPHYDHPTISKKAFDAGLHVFCEKPAGVYTKAVREMNEAAEKSGRSFQINFLMRTSGAFKKIKEIVDSGALGELRRISWIITTWYRTQNYYNSGSWRASWAGEGGGTLINQNPHQLDLLQWIAGMPKSIRAFCSFGKRRDIEVEDEATIYMEYENGATATYITSVSEFPGTNRLELAGECGKLVFEDGIITLYRTEVNETLFNKETDTTCGPIPLTKQIIEYESTPLNDCHIAMIENWIEHAEGKAELIAPGHEGINSLRISNASYLSSWKEKTVLLPFDEDEFHSLLMEKVKSSTYQKKEVKNSDFDIGASYLSR